jgi:hypothetical protein
LVARVILIPKRQVLKNDAGQIVDNKMVAVEVVNDSPILVIVLAPTHEWREKMSKQVWRPMASGSQGSTEF